MEIKFHKNSIKFLEKCSDKEKEKIRVKIKELYDFYDWKKFQNFNELDVKNLDGIWKGFRRTRIGKIRIIYQFDKASNELMIYEIAYRGDVYK